MKKRALSILLCLCMVASLFSVVTIPAMAANDTIVNATIGGDTTTIYQYAKGSGTLSSNKNYRVVWCGTSPSEINGQLVFSTYTTMASFSYEYKSIAPWGPKWYSTFYPDDEKEVSGYGNMANIEGSKQEPRFAADGYTILLSDYAADSTSEYKDDLNYWYDAGNQYRSTSGYHTTSNLYFVSEGSKVEYTLDHISENGVEIDSTKQKAGTTISKSDLTKLTNTQAIYKDSSSNTLTYNAKTDDIGFYIQNPAYPASTLNKTLSGGTNTLYLTFGGKSVQASTLSLPMDTAVTVKKNGAAWTDSAPAVTLQSGTEEAISATTVANGVSTFTNLDPAKTYKVLSGETDTGKTVKVDSTTATLDYYTLSVTDGARMSGAYLGTGGTTSGVYLSGTQVTISSGTAATGYSFDSWALSGKTVGSDSTIAGSQVTVNGNGTFTSQAKLAAPTVAVTGKNGAGTPALSTTYEDTVTLTATPSHALGDGVTYTYQWYKGGTDEANKLTGKTAQTLTLSQHDDSGDYYCNVTATNKDSTPLSASATSAKATVTISPKPVAFAVSGTSQTYQPGTARSITITDTGTKNLTASDFTVKYYKVDEDNGLLTGTTPVANAISIGRYLYVINFKTSQPGYKITIPFAVNDTTLPTIANYDNVGYLDIKAGTEQQQPISFASGAVSKYVADGTFKNALTNPNGTAATFQSSDTSVAAVAPDGTVTIKAAGSTTITATSSKDGTSPVYASYTLTVTKETVTVTVRDKKIQYSDAMPYTDITALSFSKSISIDAADYAATDLTFSGYTKGRGTGEYTIIAKGLSSDKYSFTYEAGTLTVDPKPLTASDFTVSVANKEYDGTTSASFTIAVNAVTGDVLTAVCTGAFDSENAADSVTATCTITGVAGSKADNYTLSSAVVKTAAARISPMPITFTFGTTTYLYDGQQKTVTLNWSADSLPYSGAAQAVTATVSGLVNGDAAKVTAYTGNTQTDVSTAYTATATMLDNANYTRTGSTNVTHNWSITAVAPSMALSSQILPNTGSPIAIGAAKVTGVGNDGNITERYTVTYTYYTDAARQTQTTAADGAVTDGGAPSENGTYYVTAEIASQGNYTAAAATATLTLYTPLPGGGTGSGSSPTSAGAPVIVDGKTQNIGTEKIAGDTTTVTVDQSKLGTNISGAAFGSSVVVPVSKNLSATASLAVKNIQDMAARRMTLTVQTGSVAYNLNTSAIDTAALASAFPGADMSKVPFDVTITNSSVRIEGKTPVLSPVAFTVTATYNGKTVSVDTFSAYVDRVIEVTAEQAAKITTAVVVNADGSTRHVPTNVIEKNGKYYAVINSRTNSTYALIQNKVTFADAEGKWYEATVNEMGSRKIIEGRSASAFDGAAGITRAEFAAILVRALGLPADGTSTFSDVPAHAWYTGAVATAVQYGLTEGKGNGRFDPSAAITRQEAMLMLQRAAALTEFTGARGDLDSFTDANSVGSWALDAAKWSVGSGLIQGTDGKLNAAANITRAESATIILRLLQKAGLVDVRSEA